MAYIVITKTTNEPAIQSTNTSHDPAILCAIHRIDPAMIYIAHDTIYSPWYYIYTTRPTEIRGPDDNMAGYF